MIGLNFRYIRNYLSRITEQRKAAVHKTVDAYVHVRSYTQREGIAWDSFCVIHTYVKRHAYKIRLNPKRITFSPFGVAMQALKEFVEFVFVYVNTHVHKNDWSPYCSWLCTPHTLACTHFEQQILLAWMFFKYKAIFSI